MLNVGDQGFRVSKSVPLRKSHTWFVSLFTGVWPVDNDLFSSEVDFGDLRVSIAYLLILYYY